LPGLVIAVAEVAGDLAALTRHAAAPAAESQPARLQYRSWTDLAGEYRVEAALLDSTGGAVRLQKRDGHIFTMRLERLSKADQEFVKAQSKE
jgi:hypothetical protein